MLSMPLSVTAWMSAGLLWEFVGAAVGVFVFTYGLSYVQTYTSERVARDLRTQLAGRISRQDYQLSAKTNPAQLLTNLTADVDSIKGFRGAGHRQHFFFHLHYYRGEYHAADHPVAAGALRYRHYPHHRVYLLYRFEESAGPCSKPPARSSMR
jgi:hypothetical protein